MIENIDKAAAKKLIEQNQKLINSTDIDFKIDFEVEKKYNIFQRERTNTLLIIKEWTDVIEMRKNWSRWLLRAILAIVFFDFFIIFMAGFGWMKFGNNVYIVPFFIGESLIKTLGLAIIVVKFLFNEKFISKK